MKFKIPSKKELNSLHIDSRHSQNSSQALDIHMHKFFSRIYVIIIGERGM